MQSIKDTIKTNPLAYKMAKAIVCWLQSLPYCLQGLKSRKTSRSLMLGSASKREGWTTFDIVPGADFLGHIASLALFESGSMEKIYASHVLEHITDTEAHSALKEMRRVLRPGGEVFIVVPDMVSVSGLLTGGSEAQATAMEIIYGVNMQCPDHSPQHKFGYTRQSLEELLVQCGFVDIHEFQPFVSDTSSYYVHDTRVSLCLKGKKPGK